MSRLCKRSRHFLVDVVNKAKLNVVFVVCKFVGEWYFAVSCRASSGEKQEQKKIVYLFAQFKEARERESKNNRATFLKKISTCKISWIIRGKWQKKFNSVFVPSISFACLIIYMLISIKSLMWRFKRKKDSGNEINKEIGWNIRKYMHAYAWRNDPIFQKCLLKNLYFDFEKKREPISSRLIRNIK